MILSKSILKDVNGAEINVPALTLFFLPEKVLQFGTGVLLRGLTDYVIDKANKNGLFNGRIVVVKSTAKGTTAEFDDQDNLYTLCIRGISDGKEIKENVISSAISRVIVADSAWEDILSVARSPDLKLIVSNTTEVGLQLLEESIFQSPPLSFPAKLLAVLYQRYQSLAEGSTSGIVVIATELIPDNGKKLLAIVLQLSAFNNLEKKFITWLDGNVSFCNSLVDRIVPGKPDEAMLEKLEEDLGYQDRLLSMAEPYLLWAIEGGPEVAEVLSFSTVDQGVVIAEDIELYRELKLRLLNGTHTLSSGIAYLSGIETVAGAMQQQHLRQYVSQVMISEIVPAIPYQIIAEDAAAFSKKVIDRFSNPSIEHHWISITAQYSMKIKIRILPVLLTHYKKQDQVPLFISFGFAAYLKFMRSAHLNGKQYIGILDGKEYPINDDQAPYFFKLKDIPESAYVNAVLADTAFWGEDLTALPDFITTVEHFYQSINEKGITTALAALII